jgi:hypothetical protein
MRKKIPGKIPGSVENRRRRSTGCRTTIKQGALPGEIAILHSTDGGSS